MKRRLAHKKGYNRLMERMRFNDAPELGGTEVLERCKICGEGPPQPHEGKWCPKIKTVHFFDSGNVKSITRRGGQETKEDTDDHAVLREAN